MEKGGILPSRKKAFGVLYFVYFCIYFEIYGQNVLNMEFLGL